MTGERSQRALAAAFSHRVARAALAQETDPLVQEAALACLCRLVPESGAVALARHMERPAQGDAFWIQRAAVRLALERCPERKETAEVIARAEASPSAAVRQALALFRPAANGTQDAATRRLATGDPDRKVRLAALSRLPGQLRGRDGAAAEQAFIDALSAETDEDVLRLIFELAEAEAFARVRSGAEDEARTWAARVLPGIARHHETAASDVVRRRAAAAREGIWCATTPGAFALHEALDAFARTMGEGSARRLSRTLSRTMRDGDLAGRVLAVLARRDFGLSLERAALGRLRLRRGDGFGMRLWRVLHEFRHPGTEKRQAFRHTIGRVNGGHLSAPSGVLAELAQTKVPGEPLFDETEQGWHNYLPLLDLVISATRGAEPHKIYTPEGITRIVPPRSGFGRWRARLRISRDFERLAELRNTPGSGAYLAALAEHGISVKLAPHAGAGSDTRLDRYFPALSLPALPILAGMDERWQSYIYSIYQNTLGQLAVFIALAVAWFFGRHYVLSRRIRRVRRALPLVIGGWGTRGKSGTERLKAAVFNGLGLPLMSKTTGCEAMFLQAEAYGPTKELFLFRPFDKATIWEQARVARMGRDMGSAVVLWECMGLTPSYVSILQRQWMRDDLSTITNTYPDHEDLQGPAGRNIPEVMTEFIPERSTVLTTEEQMLPILAQGARARRTRLIPVDWRAPLMIPDEALARFPYAEHPANIALVLRMAEELGLDRERSLREMADRVVPDLGVLKIYPEAPVGRRRLEFVNGMSANERFGAMGNWRRTGFAAHDLLEDPGQYLVTVVNNRGDRVPRSRVFADILANDFMADAHLLIGSNLSGMQGFIEGAWAERAARFSLRDGEGHFLSAAAAGDRIRAEARKLRVFHEAPQLAAMAAAMLGEPGAPTDPAALAAALAARGADPQEAAFARAEMERRARQLDEAEALLTAAGQHVDAALEARCRDIFGGWFRARFHVVDDYHATGEEVVGRLVSLAPPGLLTRVMGIQNIKGTGLGFIYKWQDYDAQNTALVDLESGQPDRIEAGLRALETGPVIGRLGRDRVLRALDGIDAEASRLPAAIGPRSAALRYGLAPATAPGPDTGGKGGKAGGGLLAPVLQTVEGMLDAFAAIRRRNRADRVYAELAAQRIGRNRAAQEIQALNAQQKGGWLKAALARSMPGRRRGETA